MRPPPGHPIGGSRTVVAPSLGATPLRPSPARRGCRRPCVVTVPQWLPIAPHGVDIPGGYSSSLPCHETGAIPHGTPGRLLECARLRVKDIDFETRQLVVRAGKGNKDRVTMLPATLIDPLRRQLDFAQRQHEADLAIGAGWVALPQAIERKYPNAARAWGWQWVFPATRIHIDSVTGRRRRHHFHETALQREVASAVRMARIAKPASCHTFRHSFATHLLKGVALLPCHSQGTEAATRWVSA